MGFPKPLLPLPRGETFLSAIAGSLRRAGVLGPIVVVTGHRPTAIERHARALGLSVARNPRPQEGQLSSARRGLRRALSLGATELLLWPCDAPRIRVSTLRRLLASKPPAVPTHRGVSGHPLWLDAAAASRILGARRARSLREALRGARPRALAVGDPGILDNVNGPEAYAAIAGPRLAGLLPRPGQPKSLSR